MLCCLCGVLGYLAPVHRCAPWVCCFACAVCWATWLLFTGVPARCVALRVRCPGTLGSGSPVCPLGVLCCVCGVLGHLAPVNQCAGWVCCFACAVSWATWLLFTGVPTRCVALLERCPGPLGYCSPVCSHGVLPCLCCVLGHLAPLHWCARSVGCFASAGSWATWLQFTGVLPRGVFCLCRVLGHFAPVHRCARSVRCLCVRCPGPLAPVHQFARLVRCFPGAVSRATWLLFTGVPAWCVVLCVRCPGPLGSCLPVCPPSVLCCVCGVLGPLVLVHWCARLVCCAVSWATWLLFTGVFARCVVLWVACAGRRCGAFTRPSGRQLFVAGRGCVPSRRTRVHPDGGCSVAGRSWVGCRARTRPSGRRLVLLGTCPLAVLLWFVACCACCPGLQHPTAVAAWHLSVLLGRGRRRGCLACLMAPRGAPRLVLSGRSRCSGRLSGRCGAFPQAGGLCPRLYWVVARGRQRPAENRAKYACC